MSHEIMIPTDNLPAHIINKELAKSMNEEAGEGISSGAVPRLKVVGKGSFAFKDGDEELIIKPGEMVNVDDNLYMKAVILRAKGPLSRAYYVAEFDPNASDVSAPDCFSNDGLKPDNSVAKPICDVCANCPQAAFGSALKGEGQACTQTKTLAALFPKSPSSTYKVKVTPKALRNFKTYVKKLDAAGIPLRYVFTLIGFVPEETYPVLTFQYGGPVPENAIGKIDALAESAEVLDIIEDKMSASAPKQVTTAEVQQGAKQEPVVEKVVEPEVVKEEVDDPFAAAPETSKTVEVESTTEVAGAAELTAEEIEAELFG